MTPSRFVSHVSLNFIHPAKLPSFSPPTWDRSCQPSELRWPRQQLLPSFQLLSRKQYLADALFKSVGWYRNNPTNGDCSEITRMKHITVLVIKSYDCLHFWWFSITERHGIKTGRLFQSSCWWSKSQYIEAVWPTKHKISEQIVTAGGFWPSELRNSQTRRLKGIKQSGNDPLRVHMLWQH